MNKQVLRLGGNILIGSMVGYFTYAATKDKAEELMKNSKGIMPAVIRTSHSMFATMAGYLAYRI